MDVGLAHDYLLVLRGAERTFAAMADAWPQAPIYTSLYDEDGTERRFAGHEVHTTWLQRTGVRQQGFRRLLPLFPSAMERLDLRRHDVVVSSSSAFAHGVRTRPGAVHVCYCHTPFRYAWFERARALDELPALARPLANRSLERIRRWDVAAAGRVTRYVANGERTRQRIAEVYGREAVVVHPPVAVERFARDAAPEDWLLLVGELTAHKRGDVALEAAARAGHEVRVVGDGPAREDWERRFPGARFLGRVSDAELEGLYSRALALLVPNEEEFGIAAVEAQAAGRPVVALAAGGALETVIDAETGVLVQDSSSEALAAALDQADLRSFDPDSCRRSAARFATSEFERRLRDEVSAALQDARMR